MAAWTRLRQRHDLLLECKAPQRDQLPFVLNALVNRTGQKLRLLRFGAKC